MKQFGLSLCSVLICIVIMVGCGSSGGDDDGSDIVWEKILGLELYNFGNTYFIFGQNDGETFDFIFSKDGTYTKKSWVTKEKKTGAWTVSGNDIYMNEEGGTAPYTVNTVDGILRDGDSNYINGQNGNVIGIFTEMIGTGSGVLDMCYTDEIGKYKVELQRDTLLVTFNFDDNEVAYVRKTTGGTYVEDGVYTWACNGIEVTLTLQSTQSGSPEQIYTLDDANNRLWLVEGSPILLDGMSYDVINVDYMGPSD